MHLLALATRMTALHGLRLGIIGPLPPPSGGMAAQTAQLAACLADEGVAVRVVQTNKAHTPLIGAVPIVRALARLVPYLGRLWICAGRIDVMHVMANSGWSWHLWVAPAIVIGRIRRVPVVVNYRGGEAREFFARSWRFIRITMRLSQAIVVPSGFLEGVFAGYGLRAIVVPNIVNLSSFQPNQDCKRAMEAPRLLVSRNLERIYDVASALAVLALLRVDFPRATLTVAGSGPEEGKLRARAGELGVLDAVRFVGRMRHEDMPALYREADLMLNPSLIDNTPNSILEAWASGLPVVTTDVGGIKFLVEDERTALVVPARAPAAMARAAARILRDEALRRRLQQEGLKDVQRYSWANVRNLLCGLYTSTCRRTARFPHNPGASNSRS